MTELSDELLVAYVDGQLARDQSKAIERVLENDEVAAQRVQALRSAQSRLEAAFEALLADELATMTRLDQQAVDAAGADARLAGPAKPRRLRAFMAAIGVMAIGLAGGYIVRGATGPEPAPPPAAAPKLTPSWQEDVARMQSLLGRETLEVGFESQGNADMVQFQLAAVIGSKLVIPDLSIAGLDFRRALLLNRDGERVAQLAYLPETGLPLSLYAKREYGADANPRMRDIAGVATAEWRQQGIAYVLAGLIPQAKLERLADMTRIQIAEGKSIQSALPVPAPAGETASDSLPAGTATEQAKSGDATPPAANSPTPSPGGGANAVDRGGRE